MDFMKLLNSLDELLYEVMSWLVFFPLTLWRTIVHPLTMMEYADEETHDREERQYEDTLSPPLFLLVALVLSHGLELALLPGENEIVQSRRGLAGLVNDDTSLLLLRLGIFSLFPLNMATLLLHAKRQRLTRRSLKPPFYAQCFTAGPFALATGIGMTLVSLDDVRESLAGLVVILATMAWYLAVQVAWFRRQLSTGVIWAINRAALGLLAGVIATIGLAWLLSGGTSAAAPSTL